MARSRAKGAAAERGSGPEHGPADHGGKDAAATQQEGSTRTPAMPSMVHPGPSDIAAPAEPCGCLCHTGRLAHDPEEDCVCVDAPAEPSEVCPSCKGRICVDELEARAERAEAAAETWRTGFVQSQARVKVLEVTVERLKATCNRYQIALDRKGCSGPWHEGPCCPACKDSWEGGLAAEARVKKLEAAVEKLEEMVRNG